MSAAENQKPKTTTLEMKMRVLKTLPLAIAALVTQHAFAQLPEGAVEGPINSITSQSGRLVMKVMGITINIPQGAPITSPTRTLSPSLLLDPTPLPGRTTPGFVGGTAIVNGTVDNAGVITATDVFVEPAENVVLGVVTGIVQGQVQVNGVPIMRINDPRIPSTPLRNVFGFEVKPESIPIGNPASVEGYYADGKFYAFLTEVDGPGELVDPDPQISVQRAQVRERTPNNQRGDEIDVRGGVTTSHVQPGVTTQTIRVFRVDGGRQTLIGTATATVDPTTPGFALWNFRATTAPTNDPVLGTAPTRLRFRNVSAGARDATVDFIPTLIP